MSKASRKLWFLRRLKSQGASTDSLMDIYRLFVRSKLELACPVWSNALTQGQSKAIERVQKAALRIIHGDHRMSYEKALKTLNEVTLAKRREQISLRFARKCAKNERFSHLFPQRVGVLTKSKAQYLRPKCNTRRYKTSCVPSLIRMLNQE